MIERHQRLYGFSWWVVSVAAMVFLVVAMQSLAVRHWLHANAILRLGTLSYSIYLVPGTVLFTLIHWFWGRMGRVAIFGCCAVATYGLAEILHAPGRAPDDRPESARGSVADRG